MKSMFVPVEAIPAGLAESLTEFSPYTAPAFVALLKREFGRAGYFVVTADDEPAGAMPVVLRGSGMLTRLQALIDGLPAPVWVSVNHTAMRKEICAELVNAIVREGYLKAHITDFDKTLPESHGKIVEQQTSLIDISTATGEFPPDKTLRSEIAKTVRDGVQVVPFDRKTQLTEFLALMSATESRHGRAPKYSPQFWADFVELAERDFRFQILCVAHQARLAAAHVFIVDRTTALNWQIYFDKQFASLKPNQAITAFAIEKCKSEGFRYLNLGATPPEATGVLDYKKKWGGSEYRYRTLECRSWLGRLLP